MIDIIKRTPENYSNESRDYQIIARLYTALFNVSKAYADSLSVWDNNIDNKLVQLRAKTLNFNVRYAWDDDDLEAITSCFKYLMRSKGTISAIRYCINILMKIKGIEGIIKENDVYLDKYNNLTIKLEKGVFTWGILDDLMKYILPAGITYRIIEVSTQDSAIEPIEVKYVDEISKTVSALTDEVFIGDDSEKHKIVNTFIYDDNDPRI